MTKTIYQKGSLLMKSIITEEMRYRQRLCAYALKHGVTEAAKRYDTYRQFVYRQLKKYDGTVRSLALKSRRPHHSPNAHTDEELDLIKRMYKRNGNYGLAEVYVRCCSKGYTRSFGSMCRQVRKYRYSKPKLYRKSYTRYNCISGKYPGDKVQVDIKYVPAECIRFPTNGLRYYQITAIDEYSRKRILKIVNEKSTYVTAKFLRSLMPLMGFRIKTIQVDNGTEFVSWNPDREDKTAFEKADEELHMQIRRIRPYSPWQNGRVERSHREDGKILYGRHVWTSKAAMIRSVYKHQERYNKTAKTVLGFKSPNQIVAEYFSMCNTCLDN